MFGCFGFGGEFLICFSLFNRFFRDFMVFFFVLEVLGLVLEEVGVFFVIGFFCNEDWFDCFVVGLIIGKGLRLIDCYDIKNSCLLISI